MTLKANVMMLIITAGYLCVEIPFAVHLIEVVSTGSDVAISETEKFGRLLTGLAVFIALLGGAIIPEVRSDRIGFIEAAVPVSIIFIATMAFCYFALWGYGQWTAKSATDDELRQSYNGLLAQRDIAGSGIEDIRPNMDDPAWRAFVSTIAATFDMSAAVKAKGSIGDLVAREASRQIGPVDEFRAGFFEEIETAVFLRYEDYSKGSNEYLRAMSSIKADGAEEWTRYIAELKARYPEGIPTVGWTASGIRRKVKERLPVSDNWPILDRSGFLAAYRKVAVKEIEQRYRSQSRGLPVGLSLSQFWKSKVVQAEVRQQIKRDLGIEAGGVIIPSMSDRTFQKTVYGPVFEKIKGQIGRLVVGEEGLSVEDREHLEEAYLMAHLPASALLFSLAGAALHVFKSAGYAGALVGLSRLRFLFAGLVLFGGVVAMIAGGNSITGSETYRRFEADTVMATVIGAAISIQPAFENLATGFESIGLWKVTSMPLNR
ncbi:hypothetical protein [Ensifer aridi]|uniref:hypothetical protein n=1 Tax=Ensifer aridi TaxID=1708715 RepID=UPI000A0FBCB5|nr:hypothetical protein [Ensifer aridi]